MCGWWRCFNAVPPLLRAVVPLSLCRYVAVSLRHAPRRASRCQPDVTRRDVGRGGHARCYPIAHSLTFREGGCIRHDDLE